MHRVLSIFFAASFLTCAPVGLPSVTQTTADSRWPSPRRPLPHPVVPPASFERAIQAGTRTRTGEPGPNHWQQWTDYTLRAELDTEKKRLDGSAEIVYQNHSPDTLNILFVHLLQNLHAPGAVRNEPLEVTGGVQLQHVVADGTELDQGPLREPAYAIQGTIMGIRPPRPVPPGESITLSFDWGFLVPQSGAGRMGWSEDNLFFIAYWYPQMAVYDDVVGWHIDPYLGNAEFYNGFGNYDVTVEVPDGWVVMGTGRLLNRSEVLPDPIRARLERAERSDEVVHVLTAEDLGPASTTHRGRASKLQWHFQADSVRDVAFSAMQASYWDAARTPVGDRDGDGSTDYVRVDAFYRQSAPKWQNTARYAQHSIDFLSRFTGVSYPWPHMTVVEGGGIIGGGMEFPMMTLIGDYNERGDSALYYVTAHELAHMWVPMTVNTDEKRYAWMDEGTTTFNENQARKEFFPGFDHDSPDRETYIRMALSGNEGEMMRWGDYYYTGAYGVASYAKPASVLAALRGLLGEETFVRAYHTFMRRWAFKNPKPWDFFNTFNRVTGQNLDWFWRSWYYETWTLDQAVASVTTDRDNTTIVIEDRGWVPMPARITITLEDGETLEREVPVETWLSGATTYELRVQGGSPVVRVEIDASGVFPDIDRANNVWNRS